MFKDNWKEVESVEALIRELNKDKETQRLSMLINNRLFKYDCQYERGLMVCSSSKEQADNSNADLVKLYFPSIHLYYLGQMNGRFFEGLGRLRHNGMSFAGKFSQNIAHGAGILKTNSYVLISNKIDRWGFEGFSILKTEDHSSCGEFSVNGKEGFVLNISLKESTLFLGHFEGGKAKGIGRKIIRDELMEGTWNDEKLDDGYTNSRNKMGTFSGFLSQGKFSGFGRLLGKSNKFVYSGEFKTGNFDGNGKLESQGKLFVGDFQRNKLEGKGIQKLSSSQYYFGEYEDNRPSGEGVYFNEQQVVFGTWRDGRLKGIVTVRDWNNRVRSIFEVRKGKLKRLDESELKEESPGLEALQIKEFVNKILELIKKIESQLDSSSKELSLALQAAQEEIEEKSSVLGKTIRDIESELERLALNLEKEEEVFQKQHLNLSLEKINKFFQKKVNAYSEHGPNPKRRVEEELQGDKKSETDLQAWKRRRDRKEPDEMLRKKMGREKPRQQEGADEENARSRKVKRMVLEEPEERQMSPKSPVQGFNRELSLEYKTIVEMEEVGELIGKGVLGDDEMLLEILAASMDSQLALKSVEMEASKKTEQEEIEQIFLDTREQLRRLRDGTGNVGSKPSDLQKEIFVWLYKLEASSRDGIEGERSLERSQGKQISFKNLEVSSSKAIDEIVEDQKPTELPANPTSIFQQVFVIYVKSEEEEELTNLKDGKIEHNGKGRSLLGQDDLKEGENVGEYIEKMNQEIEQTVEGGDQEKADLIAVEDDTNPTEVPAKDPIDEMPEKMIEADPPGIQPLEAKKEVSEPSPPTEKDPSEFLHSKVNPETTIAEGSSAENILDNRNGVDQSETKSPESKIVGDCQQEDQPVTEAAEAQEPSMESGGQPVAPVQTLDMPTEQTFGEHSEEGLKSEEAVEEKVPETTKRPNVSDEQATEPPKENQTSDNTETLQDNSPIAEVISIPEPQADHEPLKTSNDDIETSLAPIPETPGPSVDVGPKEEDVPTISRTEEENQRLSNPEVLLRNVPSHPESEFVLKVDVEKPKSENKTSPESLKPSNSKRSLENQEEKRPVLSKAESEKSQSENQNKEKKSPFTNSNQNSKSELQAVNLKPSEQVENKSQFQNSNTNSKSALKPSPFPKPTEQKPLSEPKGLIGKDSKSVFQPKDQVAQETPKQEDKSLTAQSSKSSLPSQGLLKNTNQSPFASKTNLAESNSTCNVR